MAPSPYTMGLPLPSIPWVHVFGSPRFHPCGLGCFMRSRPGSVPSKCPQSNSRAWTSSSGVSASLQCTEVKTSVRQCPQKRATSNAHGTLDFTSTAAGLHVLYHCIAVGCQVGLEPDHVGYVKPYGCDLRNRSTVHGTWQYPVYRRTALRATRSSSAPPPGVALTYTTCNNCTRDRGSAAGARAISTARSSRASSLGFSAAALAAQVSAASQLLVAIDQ